MNRRQRPIAGAVVSLRPGGGEASRRKTCTELFAAISAENGRFEIAHLPAARIDILARSTGFSPTWYAAYGSPGGVSRRISARGTLPRHQPGGARFP